MKQLGQKITFVIPRQEGMQKSTLIAVVNATITESDLRSENNFLAEFKKACTEWVNTTENGNLLWKDSSEDLNIGDLVQQGDLEAIGNLMNGVMGGSLDVDIYGADTGGDWMYDTVLVDRDEVTPYPSTEMPEIGMKVTLKVVEIGMMRSLPAGHTGTVTSIEEQIIVIKMDKHHKDLDEWDNNILIHEDWIGGSYTEIKDPRERLAMAFWDNVEDGRVEAGT